VSAPVHVRLRPLTSPAVLARTGLAALVLAGALAEPAAARLPDPVSKRVSMRAPVDGLLQSGFGYRWGRMHWGVDLDAHAGTPVRAALPGTVSATGWLRDYSGYGLVVKIRHQGRVETMYAHLSRALVRRGQRVGQGQVVGRAGCTGSCTGTHVHFEVRLGGKQVDPLQFLGKRLPRR
jgi:murein DD-endopeptidase MepM/ murein hydrolase activator NlpD